MRDAMKIPAHVAVLTDIRNGEIVAVDLDRDDPLAAPVWQWHPTEALGWKITTHASLKETLSDVRVGWSAYHKCHVVLFTASRGQVGVIEYPSGKCLWEGMVGVSPHAAELLPNGDMIVAASGGGKGELGGVHYLKLTTHGSYTEIASYPLYGAHGAVWDAKEQILWASGTDDVVAYTVTADSLIPVEGRGVKIPCSYGHDLMQDLADPDILWVSPSPEVYQFSKSKNALLTEFPHSDVIHPLLRAKGIASFPDGVVIWVAYGHHTSSEHPDHFSAFWPDKGVVTYTEEHAGWNKIRVFSDYHM